MQVVEDQSRGVLFRPLSPVVVVDGVHEALLHAGLDLSAQRRQGLDLRMYKRSYVGEVMIELMIGL